MIPTQLTPETPEARDQQQKAAKVKESRSISKFNDLSFALAFAITGLIVVYLPSILNRSVDWRVEGRLLGIVLAIAGAAFLLAAASKLTNREGFGAWGAATLIGAATIGLIISLHKYHMTPWAAVTLIGLVILLILVTIFALVSGFTSFFEETATSTGGQSARSDSEATASASAETKAGKPLNWYEKITLLIAVISTIATVVAVIEPLVHSLCSPKPLGCLAPRVPRFT